MMVTNEQAEEIRDGLYSEYPVWRNCDEKGRLQFITAGELAAELLEASELIKKQGNLIKGMRRYIDRVGIYLLDQIDATDRLFYLEKSKEYVE